MSAGPPTAERLMKDDLFTGWGIHPLLSEPRV